MLSTAFLLAASMVVGQGEGEKTFKTYTDFVVGGVWTTKIDGQELKHSYQPVGAKRFVQLNAKGGSVSYFAVIGVNPKSQKCEWWLFGEDGSVGSDTMTLEADGVWLLQGSGVGPKGEVSFKSRLTRVGKDEAREEVLLFKIGDANQGTPTNVWRRK